MSRLVRPARLAGGLASLMLMASLFLALALLAARVLSSSEPLVAPAAQVHVVERYDSLWKIARRYYPDRDPREVVWALRQANPGVNPGNLRLGQEIILPGQRPGQEEVSAR